MHGFPRRLYRALPPDAGRIGPRAAYRFFRDAGSVVAGHQFVHGTLSEGEQPTLDGLDVTLQAIADRQATGTMQGQEWNRFLKAMEGFFDFAFSRQAENLTTPLVDGHRLMKHLGLAPGPKVGVIMRELAEAQAAGTVTDVDGALALAEELVEKGEK